VVVDQALVLERVRVRVLGLGLVQVQAHLLLRQVLAPGRVVVLVLGQKLVHMLVLGLAPGRVVVLVLGQKLVHMLVLGLAPVQETVGVKEHGGLGMLKEE
jgi:hypothetical protein